MVKQTYELKSRPVIIGCGSIVGPKEGQGPLRSYFDQIVDDDKMGQDSFEKGECEMYQSAIQLAIADAQLQNDRICCMLGGDLLNQIISSGYSARQVAIPFLGLYGACSTMVESMVVGSMLIAGGFMDNALCVTSSHFSTAERQFRFPLEMGGQRQPTAQWTVTGAGATVLSASGSGPAVSRFTIGKVIDLGITDSGNMGAAMAPAAADTLMAHFSESGLTPDYYDCIYTGDLGSFGLELLHKLLADNGLKPGNILHDCGNEIFDLKQQDVQCGGSGCGCAASVFNGYLMKQLRQKNIHKLLLMATGALMSTVSSQQGESIPGIAHAIAVEV